jgi:hypothetical protein
MTMREKLIEAIGAAFEAQFGDVYMWDTNDEDLFARGERSWTKYQDGSLKADRFDLGAVADAILTTLAEPTHEIILAGLDVDDSVQRFWPKMVLAIRDEVYADHVNSGK